MNIKFIILLLGLLLLPLSAAAGLVPPPTGLEEMYTFCDLLQLIKNIVNFIAFQLAPAVGGLMLLVGGIIILTGGGTVINPDKSTSNMGKKIITQTVVGLVIIYLAWLIVNTVITGLAVGVGTWTPANWWKFNCP